MNQDPKKNWTAAVTFPAQHSYTSSFSGAGPVSDPGIRDHFRPPAPPPDLTCTEQLIYEVYATGELDRLIDRS